MQSRRTKKNCLVFALGCPRLSSDCPLIRLPPSRAVPPRLRKIPALGCGGQNDIPHDRRNPRSRICSARNITKSKTRERQQALDRGNEPGGPRIFGRGNSKCDVQLGNSSSAG